ncbi:transposase [Acaryochloris marina]|uniref:transposase n=1 Tax=Acaryochloris marina TaxID=155978 RepID=UPI001BAF0852|nr:transposase [Acaryochloris marina]QUY44844.1 transposase [Acaryochloris marina S15]
MVLDPNRPEIRRPRYKGKCDRVNTIPCESFRAQAKIDFATDRLQLPGLGWIGIPALSVRLGSVMIRQQVQMAKYPDRYPELAKKLNERDAFLSVARWLERDIPMPEKITGDIKKAINHAECVIKKSGQVTQAIAKLRELSEKRELQQAINDLCTPGVFRICRRGDKFYLQIAVRSVVNPGNPRPKPIGLDVGLDLLCCTTNGVQTKHPDLRRLTSKIIRLKQKQSQMMLGSANWHRIQKKISNAERQKTKAKRNKQHYIAGWLVDTNQHIAIKKVNPKEVVARPLPRPSEDNEQYLRNGREDQRIINYQSKEASVGQFISLILSKASDRENRMIELVACEPEATPTKILEASSFHSGGPQSEPAQNLQRTREGDAVTLTMRGESNSDSSTTHRSKQAHELANPAKSPKPFKRPRRKPWAERKTF